MPKKTQVGLGDVTITKVIIDPVQEKVQILWERRTDNGSVYDSGEATLFRNLPAPQMSEDAQGNPVELPQPESWGQLSTGEFNSLNAILNKARGFIDSRPYID